MTREQIAVASMFDMLTTIAARASFVSDETLEDLKVLIRREHTGKDRELGEAMCFLLHVAEHVDD